MPEMIGFVFWLDLEAKNALKRPQHRSYPLETGTRHALRRLWTRIFHPAPKC